MWNVACLCTSYWLRDMGYLQDSSKLTWASLWGLRELWVDILWADMRCTKALHFVKKCPYSELFCSAFFPNFPAFGLNTERYGVSLRIQSECGKMREKYRPEQLWIGTLFKQCCILHHCLSLVSNLITGG